MTRGLTVKHDVRARGRLPVQHHLWTIRTMTFQERTSPSRGRTNELTLSIVSRVIWGRGYRGADGRFTHRVEEWLARMRGSRRPSLRGHGDDLTRGEGTLAGESVVLLIRILLSTERDGTIITILLSHGRRTRCKTAVAVSTEARIVGQNHRLAAKDIAFVVTRRATLRRPLITERDRRKDKYAP